jgi:hypothetical protein
VCGGFEAAKEGERGRCEREMDTEQMEMAAEKSARQNESRKKAGRREQIHKHGCSRRQHALWTLWTQQEQEKGTIRR